MDITIGIIGAIVFLVLLFMGVHVSIALGTVGFLGFVVLTGFERAIMTAGRFFYTGASSYALAVLPLFIFMGHLVSSAGLVERAVRASMVWLGNFRAGLYYVVIAACSLFAAASGSATATSMSVGKSLYPEMVKANYDRTLSLCCIAASGTIGVMIPPSIPLIIYGVATEESIARLFLAGVIPGILEALVYALGIFILTRFRPSLSPPPLAVTRYTWGQRLKTIPGMWGIFVLLAVILGGIYGGIFTPNEAAAVATLVALIMFLGRFRGGFMAPLRSAITETVSTTGVLMLIILTSTLFSRFLIFTGVFDSLRGLEDLSPFLTLVVFLGAFFVMGMFISSMAALLIIAPLAHVMLVPTYDPIWLGLIMVKMFEIGSITPPVGFNIFVANAIDRDLPITKLYAGTTVFWVMDLITLALMMAFPQLVLWLPNLAG